MPTSMQFARPRTKPWTTEATNLASHPRNLLLAGPEREFEFGFPDSVVGRAFDEDMTEPEL
jgi:hypothetical protein